MGEGEKERKLHPEHINFLYHCDVSYLEEAFVYMSINIGRSSEDWPHLGLGNDQEGMWEGRGERLFPDGSAACQCLDPGKVLM